MGWSMISVLWVALGGALGSVARYGVSTLAGQLISSHNWVGTLSVNVIGSFLIALLMVVGKEQYPQSLFFSPFFMIGFCGGFTTFSTFCMDAYKLYAEGAMGLAVLYLFLSLSLSCLALFLGLNLGERLIR